MTAEDYPNQQWIQPLLTTLNAFMEQVVAALNKGLTVTDNLSGAVFTVELDGNFPLKLAWSLPQKPVSVLVGNCYRSDGASFTLSSAVQVQWQYNQAGQLEIDGVVGVTPSSSTKYKLVLQCITG